MERCHDEGRGKGRFAMSSLQQEIMQMNVVVASKQVPITQICLQLAA
jgi:hypothetical protein